MSTEFSEFPLVKLQSIKAKIVVFHANIQSIDLKLFKKLQ